MVVDNDLCFTNRVLNILGVLVRGFPHDQFFSHTRIFSDDGFLRPFPHFDGALQEEVLVGEIG